MALDTNLVSYWKLDEASGNAADAVGSNTLTNNGSMPYGTGLINNGAQPASTGTKYLSITDAAQTGLDFGTGDFSINFWMKSSETVTQREIIEKQSSSGAAGGYYQIHWDNTNAGRLQFDASDFTNTATFSSAGTYNDGNWHMVTMVRVGNTISCYVDGALLGTGTAGGSFNVSGDGSFFIGHGNNGTYTGTIDEVGAWSRALSAGEVTSLYNSGAGFAYPFAAAASSARRRTLLGVGL